MKKIFAIFACCLVVFAFYFLLNKKQKRNVINITNINKNINTKNMQKIQVLSKNFENNSFIPAKYTCKQDDVNPNIYWDSVDDAKSYVLIVEDPDAPMGNWIHWIVYNLKQNNIPENWDIDVYQNESNIKFGINDFKKLKYGGPCPPSGTHRYFFKVYALDITLDDAKSGLTKNSLFEKINDHIIGYGELIGLFKK